MNNTQSFLEIREFLNQHIFLHEKEALVRYPFEKNPYLDWVDEIQRMEEETKFKLENTLNPELLKNKAYKTFLTRIHELIKIPLHRYEIEEIDPILGRKIKAKKRHEIGIIKKQVDDLCINNFIDIGSGAGHLSSLLLFNNKKSSLCIDMNSANQEIGKKKLSVDYPNILERINFETAFFSKASKLPIQKQTALIGLHCCGDLSVDIIKKQVENQYDCLLNYGCCYNKLSSQAINLSKIAKKDPIHFTNHALTIATKSFKAISRKEYEYRKRVKFFRYTLHIFLHDFYGREFENLGSGTPEDYQGDFAEYCFKYVHDMPKEVTKKKLIDFYNLTETQDKVQLLLDYGIIRSHIARVVELYLILDRALFLEENNFHVEVCETFDKDISPRNISLMATKTQPL